MYLFMYGFDYVSIANGIIFYWLLKASLALNVSVASQTYVHQNLHPVRTFPGTRISTAVGMQRMNGRGKFIPRPEVQATTSKLKGEF
jgi:hypothetical protein